MIQLARNRWGFLKDKRLLVGFFFIFLGVFISTVICTAHAESTGGSRETLSGDWGGVRSRLAEHGVSFEFVYTGEAVRVMDGGVSRGSAFLHSLDLSLDLNLERLIAWKGGTMGVYAAGTQGESPSAHAGDFQALSNIDVPDRFSLYEAWFDQSVWEDRVSIRFGLTDISSEFDVLETAGLFLHSSQEVGIDLSQSGVNGPSFFPATGLSLRLKLTPHERFSIQTAVFDAVPGNPNDPEDFKISWREEDGVLSVSEFKLSFNQKTKEPNDTNDASHDESASYAQLVLGGWVYSKKLDHVYAVDALGNPEQARSFGLYGYAELWPYREAADAEQGLATYVRLGYARDSVNPVSGYIGSGVVYTGAIPDRDLDQVGFSVAAAIFGDGFKTAQAQSGTSIENAEIALELTYRLQVTPWFSLQPDLQYMINPSGDPAIDNAFVVGSRVELSF